MKTNYSDLAGVSVAHMGSEVIGVVVDAEYGVGITVVAKLNNKRKLFCLTYKDHALYKSCTKTRYRKAFHETVRQIKSGTLYSREIDTIIYGRESTGNQAQCAFGK